MRLSPGISTLRSRGMVVCGVVVLGRVVRYWSALTLLVAGVLADDANNIVAADDPAGFAEAFDRGADFHGEWGRVAVSCSGDVL